MVAKLKILGEIRIKQLLDDFRFPLLLGKFREPQGIKDVGVLGRSMGKQG